MSSGSGGGGPPDIQIPGFEGMDGVEFVTHVRQSRALILVLTRKVLTRPYCIIEVLTAIESRIPIVCVTVADSMSMTVSVEPGAPRTP